MTLADPSFHEQGKIDIIFGVGVYRQIIAKGIKKLTNNTFALQKTRLGWIAFGEQSNNSSNIPQHSVISMVSMTEIDANLRRFWELDAQPEERGLTDDFCEKHFKRTVQRQADGRYIVALPFKDENPNLGDSRKAAMARFLSMERKFKRDPDLKKDYHDFMREYITLGHMCLATSGKGMYYLPHHAVMKEESTTTKTRVVFDGSCKSSNGKSLNELLCVGPKLQEDISQILTRWRKHKIAFTADIEKMFRQILVREEDRDYQRILWRFDEDLPVQEYVLNTVTYGTAAATYLSVRVLHQLAEDEGAAFQMAQRILTHDFYVDDLLSGADTLEEAIEAREQLSELLNRGGFNLRKWATNEHRMLQGMPNQMFNLTYVELSNNDFILALGIRWNPRSDELSYKTNVAKVNNITKRYVLSSTASIYDPTGNLAPVTVNAKMFIQRLWKEGITWDQKAPTDMEKEWMKFNNDLNSLSSIKIPRWIGTRNHDKIQYHGFADASQRAYAAVVYVRLEKDGDVQVHMLAAKTRVKPLKSTVSLPRLELCAATLLAELINSLDMEIADNEIFAWTDSEIVLAWLKKDPSNWDSYVGNRVEKINRLIPSAQWEHVPSSQNPADLPSRGMSGEDLRDSKMWWNGPEFLTEARNNWPRQSQISSTAVEDVNLSEVLDNERVEADRNLQEMYEAVQVLFAGNTSEESEVTTACIDTKGQKQSTDNEHPLEYAFTKVSTFVKLKRIVAYWKRYITILRCKVKDNNNYSTDRLSASELSNAEDAIISTLQEHHFRNEIHNIVNKCNQMSKKIANLFPIWDDNLKILRVGGRIGDAGHISYEQKHPALLPAKSHVTHLIIKDAHNRVMHGGPQLTLNQVRQKYWIVNGKGVVRAVLRKCIPCFRYNNQAQQQVMANIPEERVTPSPPFTICGVDYAGPFQVKCSNTRGTKSMKGYVALFVCFTTKAIHLEFVSSLSTETFLAALKRFIARRGKPYKIYSDQGTNFVGANNTLNKELRKAIKQAEEDAAKRLANEGITWVFNPPATPHFGGLWEAGVKSLKWHLKRTLSSTTLSYEEFATVLTEVEAVLNSRPLTSLSSDPRDCSALSPGHFLIGRQLTAHPGPEVSNPSLTNRWAVVEKMHQTLWDKWSREYLNELQKRNKWQHESTRLKEGDVVLVREDNIPPLQWPLARVIKVHPGNDGNIRVVTLKTQNNSEKQRPVVKLAKLPIDYKDESPGVGLTNEVTTGNDPPATNTRSKTKVQSQNVSLAVIAQVVLHVFLMMTTVFAINNTNASIRHFHGLNYTISHPPPGFYIEKLGVAYTKRGNLKVEASFLSEDPHKDINDIDRIYTNIAESCSLAQNTTEYNMCQIFVTHLDHMKGIIHEKIVEVIGYKRRKKRNIITSLWTSIFGSDDGADPNAVMSNQRALLQTLNQHTIMLNERISQSNNIIENKLKMADKEINELSESISSIKDWFSDKQFRDMETSFLIAYLLAEGYYNELNILYDKAIDIIHRKISIAEVVPMGKLKEMVQNTLKSLGPEFKIIQMDNHPVDFKNNGTQLIATGYIDILDSREFDMWHITPVPHDLGNATFVIPHLNWTTLAFHYNSQSYFKADIAGKVCKSIYEHMFICEPETIKNIQKNPDCIISKLFSKNTEKPCDTYQVQIPNVLWKALAQGNAWLYAIHSNTHISLICHGQRQEILLREIGIINIKDGCTIVTPKVTLVTKIHPILRVTGSFIRPVDVKMGLGNVTHKRVQILAPEPIDTSEPIFSKVVPVPTTTSLTLVTVTKHPVFSISMTLLIIAIATVLWKTRSVWRRKVQDKDNELMEVQSQPQVQRDRALHTIRLYDADVSNHPERSCSPRSPQDVQ